jgi:nucleoside 2-deoxyribosyltransferase
MIRVYIAAAKSQQARAERRAQWHRERGTVVVSTWHEQPVAEVDPEDREAREQIARQCRDEIDSSGRLELLAGGDPRGALWELGFASGRGLTTVVEPGCPTLFDSQAIRELDPSWDKVPT